MKVHYTDKAWADRNGGVIVNTGGGTGVLQTGATVNSAGLHDPPASATARQHNQRSFHRVRRDDAREDLAKLEPILVERKAKRDGFNKHLHLPDAAFGWDADTFGEKPATPEAAADKLREVIALDSAALAELEAIRG